MSGRIALRAGLAGAFVAAAAAAAWFAAAPRRISAEVAAAVSEPGDPEAGKNVFYIAGCESCHQSPGQSDPLRLGGGIELKTPFGSFYPPNITPDRHDGIGGWSAEDFANALMAGVVAERRTPLSGAALHILLSHVDQGRPRSLRLSPHAAAGRRQSSAECGELPLFDPPRDRHLEAPLYAEDRPSASRLDPVDPEGLGRYLVQGPGHCAECHSPRTFLGGIIDSRRLTGGPLPDRQGQGAEHHRRWPQRLVRRRRRDRALDRLHPLGRRARRPDGGGRSQPRAGSRAGPCGNRALSEVI